MIRSLTNNVNELNDNYMFGKVKQFLGIEGVKLEIILPDEIYAFDGVIEGKLRFRSMNEQTVKAIRVVLIERYSRGRKGERLTDDYELGELIIKKAFTVPANQTIERDFTLKFKMVNSEMDDLENKNILFGGLVKVAKMLQGVNSEHRLEATAEVGGVALNPFVFQQSRLLLFRTSKTFYDLIIRLS